MNYFVGVFRKASTGPAGTWPQCISSHYAWFCRDLEQAISKAEELARLYPEHVVRYGTLTDEISLAPPDPFTRRKLS